MTDPLKNGEGPYRKAPLPKARYATTTDVLLAEDDSPHTRKISWRVAPGQNDPVYPEDTSSQWRLISTNTEKILQEPCRGKRGTDIRQLAVLIVWTWERVDDGAK